jgi:hypothetical protein
VKIYLAGICAAYRPQVEGRHLLVSFHEPSQRRLITKGWNAAGWMLDSGAFSAWRLGSTIDLEEYMRFIDANEEHLDGYVALDVIPGAPGRMPTMAEAEEATQKTKQNLDKMLQAGLSPIPVYHEGESIEVLDDYVSMGFPLIALGGTASRGKKQLMDWLLPIFQRHPDQRFHGLAMTQERIIRNLPFHSVDSTSWLNFAKYGLDANLYLLKGRTVDFYRSLGIQCLMDMPQCPDDAAPAHDGGQLPMFTLQPEGGAI